MKNGDIDMRRIFIVSPKNVMQVQTIIENSVCELFLTFAREAESLVSMYLEEE